MHTMTAAAAGTSSVVAQCTDCGLSFVNGPADETRALRYAYAGQERLDLTPANQHNYPLGDLTIAFWVSAMYTLQPLCTAWPTYLAQLTRWCALVCWGFGHPFPSPTPWPPP